MGATGKFTNRAGSAFTGFPVGGFEFFLELQARQSRDWFKAKRERFETLWERPVQALLDDLALRLSHLFPDIHNSHRQVFRIQRDTRFSPDKSPYKTDIARRIPVRPEIRCFLATSHHLIRRSPRFTTYPIHPRRFLI